MTNSNNHLQFDNVSASYDTDSDVIKDISFTLSKGEAIAVIGSSGSGKSTLLKTINCTVPINKGKIIYNSQDVSKLKARQLRKLRRDISYIFQDYNLIDNKLVLENVLLGRLGHKSFFSSLFGLYSSNEIENAYKSLEAVGLIDKYKSRADQLSGGQKQRVAIARSLVQGSNLLIADEPVSSLDPIIAEKILELFCQINTDRNISIIASLHDVHLAKKYFKRIIALKNGEIFFDDNSFLLTDDILEKIYT